jgi:hypothetical protein
VGCCGTWALPGVEQDSKPMDSDLWASSIRSRSSAMAGCLHKEEKLSVKKEADEEV